MTLERINIIFELLVLKPFVTHHSVIRKDVTVRYKQFVVVKKDLLVWIHEILILFVKEEILFIGVIFFDHVQVGKARALLLLQFKHHNMVWHVS